MTTTLDIGISGALLASELPRTLSTHNLFSVFEALVAVTVLSSLAAIVMSVRATKKIQALRVMRAERRNSARERRTQLTTVLLALSRRISAPGIELRSTVDTVLRKAARALCAECASAWRINPQSDQRNGTSIHGALLGRYERTLPNNPLESETETIPTSLMSLLEDHRAVSNYTPESQNGAAPPTFTGFILRRRGSLDCAIRIDGSILGLLCFGERAIERKWNAAERSFAASVADLLALLLQRETRRLATPEPTHHERALNAAIEGIAILDSQQRYLYLNGAHARLYGFDSPGEMIGKHWSQSYSEQQRRRVEQALSNSITSLTPGTVTAVARRKDGSEFSHELSFTPLPEGGATVTVIERFKPLSSRSAGVSGDSLMQLSSLSSRITVERPPQILIIEDHHDVREVTTQMLITIGYSVIAARDGIEALNLYAQHSATLRVVIADILMPRMGGIECVAKLRAANPSLGIILSSGLLEHERPRLPFGEEKSLSFVQKPYHLSTLSQAVEKILPLELVAH